VLSPNGTIDTNRTSQSDLALANSLLRPLTLFARAQSQTSPAIDIWKLLNSLFVGYYWFILGDLGQESPVSYNVPDDFLVSSNFKYSWTNNLFLNPTLAGTVFSNVGVNETLVDALTIPNWAENEPLPKFRWTYLCNQRQLKPALDLVVSVFGLALSLLHSVYVVSILLFGWILWSYGHNADQAQVQPEAQGEGSGGSG
jgi:hypothetical protein